MSSIELSLLFNALVTPLNESINMWSAPEPAVRFLIQVKSGWKPTPVNAREDPVPV